MHCDKHDIANHTFFKITGAHSLLRIVFDISFLETRGKSAMRASDQFYPHHRRISVSLSLFQVHRKSLLIVDKNQPRGTLEFTKVWVTMLEIGTFPQTKSAVSLLLWMPSLSKLCPDDRPLLWFQGFLNWTVGFFNNAFNLVIGQFEISRFFQST